MDVAFFLSSSKGSCSEAKENSFSLLYLTLILQFQSGGDHKEEYLPQIHVRQHGNSYAGRELGIRNSSALFLSSPSLVWEKELPPAAQDFPFFRWGRAGSRQETLIFAQHSEIESCLQTPTSAPLIGERSKLGWKPGSESASLD